MRRPSLLSQDDSHYHYPLSTRTGTLASLIRSRSQHSLNGSVPPPVNRHASDDEEAAAWVRHEDDDIDVYGSHHIISLQLSQCQWKSIDEVTFSEKVH